MTERRRRRIFREETRMLPIESILHETAALVEAELEQRLASERCGDTILAQAMRYATLGGGKRIRAFLTIHFCRMLGGSDEASLPFAAAIEMVHAYSLVHDDLPCMDNDDMRRGKPSVHKAFGEANALLAGDALLTHAFGAAAENEHVPQRSAVAAVRILAEEAGALGMAGGQYYDLSDDCPDFASLRQLQRMKTGALLRAAALLGCYAASDSPSADALAAAERYADNLGFAFQIEDDLLDVTGDQNVLGKPIGSDARNGKKTVLSFLTSNDAAALARRCTNEAKDAMSPFPASGYLCELAEFLLDRKS